MHKSRHTHTPKHIHKLSHTLHTHTLKHIHIHTYTHTHTHTETHTETQKHTMSWCHTHIAQQHFFIIIPLVCSSSVPVFVCVFSLLFVCGNQCQGRPGLEHPSPVPAAVPDIYY